MYVSLNGSLTGGRVPWPEFVRLAAKLGYPGVDLNLSRAMQDGAAETRALLEHLRLKPSSAGLPVEFRKDDATFEADLKKLGQAARFAGQVGEQATMFFRDPSGNALEFKSFRDRSQLFAK